jgi:hypothetical protein
MSDLKKKDLMKADDVKILSYVPGRVRLRVKALKGNRNLAKVAQKEISAVPGVKEVTINELTGSVLLRYENSMLGNQESVDAIFATLSLLFPSADIDKIRTWLADKGKKERKGFKYG